MGMTDRQVAMFIRMLMGRLEEAKSQDSKEEVVEKLDTVMKELQVSIEE